MFSSKHFVKLFVFKCNILSRFKFKLISCRNKRVLEDSEGSFPTCRNLNASWSWNQTSQTCCKSELFSLLGPTVSFLPASDISWHARTHTRAHTQLQSILRSFFCAGWHLSMFFFSFFRQKVPRSASEWRSLSGIMQTVTGMPERTFTCTQRCRRCL